MARAVLSPRRRRWPISAFHFPIEGAVTHEKTLSAAALHCLHGQRVCGAGDGSSAERHGQRNRSGSAGWPAAWRNHHVDRFGSNAHLRDRRGRSLPLSQRAARHLQVDGGAFGLHLARAGQRPRSRWRERRLAVRDARGDGAGDRHRRRHFADRRLASDRYRHQLHAGRAQQSADVARSLGAAAHRPRRADGPREHRRKRNGSAVQLCLQGCQPLRHGVDDGRRGHHGHVGQRRLADLLRLRRLRRDSDLDLRSRHPSGDGRRGIELRREARNEPVPGNRSRLFHQRRPRGLERA